MAVATQRVTERAGAGVDTGRRGVKEPSKSLTVEPNKQKPLCSGELDLIGALTPPSIFYSAKLPRLGEGQAPFPTALPALPIHPFPSSRHPLWDPAVSICH